MSKGELVIYSWSNEWIDQGNSTQTVVGRGGRCRAASGRRGRGSGPGRSLTAEPLVTLQAS
jgi:hypothetical protein